VSTIARSLLLAQLGFFLAFAVCAVIAPQGLVDNHGWSYYEGRGDTVVPYFLGVLGGILLIAYAARLAERSSAPAGLALGLRLLALFLFLDLGTPDTVSDVFNWAHIVASTVLFLFQLLFALWIVGVMWRTRFGVALVSVQVGGGLVAMFSEFQLIPLLGPGILLFQVSFGVLLVASTAALRSPEHEDAATGEEVPAPAVN
jgi:hypothetical protein